MIICVIVVVIVVVIVFVLVCVQGRELCGEEGDPAAPIQSAETNCLAAAIWGLLEADSEDICPEKKVDRG